MDAYVDPDLHWFEDQVQYWLDLIAESNSPCYRPMIIILLSSMKSLSTVIMDVPIEKHAPEFFKVVSNKAAESNETIRCVMYFFHVMREEFKEENPVKRTTLHMHLFVPGQSTMKASSCWECTLYEGIKGDGTDDTVYLEPEEEPDNVNIPERLKILWESPFDRDGSPVEKE